MNETAFAPDRPRLLPGRRVLLLGLLGTSVAAFLAFWYRYMDVLARGGERPWQVPLVEEVTGVFGAVLLFVPVIWLTRRWRWRGIPWPRQAGLHLLGLAAFATLHTSLLWGSRSALFPLLGLGTYDYGHMPLRYLMELGIQIPSGAGRLESQANARLQSRAGGDSLPATPSSCSCSSGITSAMYSPIFRRKNRAGAVIPGGHRHGPRYLQMQVAAAPAVSSWQAAMRY